MTEESMDLAVFDPIKAQLAVLAEKDAQLVFDHKTPEGEKELRSYVARVRGYKGDIKRAHETVKRGALVFGRKVDAIKNELTAGVQKIIDVRMKPLDEIEDAKRKAAEAIVEAERVAKEKAEAERVADLERRETALAEKEAATDTEALRQQIESDKLEAAKQAEISKVAAVIRANEQAERDKVLAVERAEREKQVALDAHKEKARQDEAKRQAVIDAEVAEKKRLDEKEAERVANKSHRSKIHRAIEEFLRDYVLDAEASIITEELISGNIPHVTINY